MRFAFSPCPNDTFMFHALVHGLCDFPVDSLTVELHDIARLNQDILSKKPDISKISVFALGHILDEYVMLPVGGAIGHGNGQKLVACTPFPLADIAGKRVAIPGRNTTAHFLANLLLGAAKSERFCLYNEVVPLVKSGAVDAGIILHETRFTFEREGLVEIADFGKLWDERFNLPLPLGCVVARRSLGETALCAITTAMQQSLRYAWDHPFASSDYVLQNSIEKDPKIVAAHIDLFVNGESMHVSPAGISAVERMLHLGHKMGFFPSIASDWLLKI